jgi:hypothetical protein
VGLTDKDDAIYHDKLKIRMIGIWYYLCSKLVVVLHYLDTLGINIYLALLLKEYTLEKPRKGA